MQTHQASRISALRSFARLPEQNQEEAKSLSDVICAVWPRPAMSQEQRLFFTDDVAQVYAVFGFATVESAISWLRQNSQHRPSIKELRDACAAHSSRRPAKPLHTELDDYYAGRKTRPQDYIPVALIVRDAQNLSALKRAREKAGNPMSREEVELWLATRNDETASEWANMVKSGRHLAPAPLDVKRRASGDQAMTRIL